MVVFWGFTPYCVTFLFPRFGERNVSMFRVTEMFPVDAYLKFIPGGNESGLKIRKIRIWRYMSTELSPMGKRPTKAIGQSIFFTII